MKKYIFIPVAVVSAVIIMVLLLSALLIHILGSSGAPEETKIMTSISPDNSITLEAYQVNGGATVDYSVKVYLIQNGKKELIYNAYHESEADIIWLDNDNVSINGKTLNLSAGEKFDWRSSNFDCMNNIHIAKSQSAKVPRLLLRITPYYWELRFSTVWRP